MAYDRKSQQAMNPIEVPRDLGAYIQGKFMVQVGYSVLLFKMAAS